MLTVLVTGGCGYIGAHAVYELIHRGYRVIVIDRQVAQLINHPNVHYVQCDLASRDLVATVCTTYGVSAVMHAAGSILVGQSVTQPYSYYENNVAATLGLLEVMRTLGITTLVNISSAAVYAGDKLGPLSEQDAGRPTSPYGWTKYIVEQILQDAAIAYGLQSVSLRLFNVAGATPDENLFECHYPETHLIPRVIHAARMGVPIRIYGTDYLTADGTAERDYVHVRDVARALCGSLEYIQRRQASLATAGLAKIYNIASGVGVSVTSVIRSCQELLGIDVPMIIEPRRAGDPAILVADIQAAARDLGWQPQESALAIMIRDAAALSGESTNCVDQQRQDHL